MTYDEYQQKAERTSGARGLLYQGKIDWKNLSPYSFTEMSVERGNEALSILFEKARAERRLMAACMGLCGEAGETVDYLKKVVAHGHDLDLDKVKKELGDTLYYVAEVCSCLGISMSEVASGNIEKLKARYPDGFTTEKSINRKEA